MNNYIPVDYLIMSGLNLGKFVGWVNRDAITITGVRSVLVVFFIITEEEKMYQAKLDYSDWDDSEDEKDKGFDYPFEDSDEWHDLPKAL